MSYDGLPLGELLDQDSGRWAEPPRRPGRPDGGRPGRGGPPRAVLVVGGLLVLALILAVVVIPRLGGQPDRTVTASAPSPSAAAAATTQPPTPTVSPTPAALLKPSKAKLTIGRTMTSAGPKLSLPWASSGQAQVEVVGLGTMGRSGSGAAVPIASIAKVMTAYTVLRDHPLSAGQSGPTITVSDAEAAAYPDQKAQGLSVVVVAAGEQLTERDALKGLLIASGDNMAEILARWDAGGEPAFVQRMNRNAARLGMSRTHYNDSTGLDPGTVSTPSDLLRLAPVAMANSTIAQLTSTSSDSIPLNSPIHNPNSLLGVHNVFGIKTGTTTAAGGCLLFAARKLVDGDQIKTIYGVVLGIGGDRNAIHSNARDAADALVVAAGDSLHRIILIHHNQTVATLVGENGKTVRLTVAKAVAVTGWSGQKFRFSLPSSLHTGRAPTELIIHTPNGTRTVRLVKQKPATA